MLVEEGDGESIMEILKPIAEQNESTLSMGNKLEVCRSLRKESSVIEWGALCWLCMSVKSSNLSNSYLHIKPTYCNMEPQ